MSLLDRVRGEIARRQPLSALSERQAREATRPKRMIEVAPQRRPRDLLTHVKYEVLGSAQGCHWLYCTRTAALAHEMATKMDLLGYEVRVWINDAYAGGLGLDGALPGFTRTDLSKEDR